MRYVVSAGGEERAVEVVRPAAGGGPACRVRLGDRTHEVVARPTGGGGWLLVIDGRPVEVHVVRRPGTPDITVCLEGHALELTCRTEMEEQLARGGRAAPGAGAGHERDVRASMPGKVVAVKVQPGDVVAEGQRLVVLEAMKMENEIRARGAARIAAVHVRPGDAVEGGALLVELERVEDGV
jgi:biotin carboxyl carrier protein